MNNQSKLTYVQRQQEIAEYLNELSAIVDQYNPRNEYLIGASILAFNAICVIVILEIGVFFGLLLIGVGFVPVALKLADAPPNQGVSETDLSERACCIMSSCIQRCENPYSEVYYIRYGQDGNIKLYQEFVALFPHMASKKLKKLSRVKIRRW